MTARGRISTALAGIVLLTLGASPSSAQSSDEGAPFLMLPVGAGASAMGRAASAMPGEESSFWNPSGLAWLPRSRLLFIRGDVAAGRSTAVSALFARPGLGTLGVSYVLWDEGDQEYTDAFRNLLGRVSFRDHLVVISAAAPLASGLAVGTSFKVVRSGHSCRGSCGDVGASSTGYAVDLGLQWLPLADVPLRLGAMVAHLGPRFQLENASQSDPLPTRVRASVAYDVLHALRRSDLKGWLAVEVEDRPGYRGGTQLYVGSELAAGNEQAFFVRMGYAGDGALPRGARVGVGLRLDRYHLSVAKSLSASSLDVSEPLFVSMSVGW